MSLKQNILDKIPSLTDAELELLYAGISLSSADITDKAEVLTKIQEQLDHVNINKARVELGELNGTDDDILSMSDDYA